MDRVKESNRALKPEAQTVRSEKTALLWAIQSGGLSLLTFLSFFPQLFHLQEYLFFPLLLLALGTAWIDGTAIWSRSPIDLPLVLFIAWVLLSIPFALDPVYSFQEWRKFLASALVFYWVLLVLQNSTSTTILKVFLWTIVAGIIFQCSYGLIDFVAQGGSLKSRLVRAAAPYSGFQELTTYMVMAIPLLIVTIVVSRTWWQRLISYGAVGLALLAPSFYVHTSGMVGDGGAGNWIWDIHETAWVTGRPVCRLWLCECRVISHFSVGISPRHFRSMDTEREVGRLEIWVSGNAQTANSRVGFWN